MYRWSRKHNVNNRLHAQHSDGLLQSHIENQVVALPISAIETKIFLLIDRYKVCSIATFVIISYDKEIITY